MSDRIDVAIIGAGISGLGMAAHLAEQCPTLSYTILERRPALGGTWDLFRYPGVRSDSDMFTLGYAFAPWLDDKAIASGATILDYLHRVADERAITAHIRYQCHVTRADWDSGAARWLLTMADGTTQAARFVFLGAGYYDYDQPHDAAIAGLGAFKGQVIHPQSWPADYDWTGRHVVVIGSGATAVTLVPALADKAASVTMLQRTPSWYFAAPARDALANLLRRLLPARLAHRLIRAKNITVQDWLFRFARRKPAAVAAFLTKAARKALGPAWDARHFTPPYAPWEQRLCVVPDGDLFAAVRASKARVVTARIAMVEADGIRLEDGAHLPADTIVTATGLALAVAGGIAFTVDGVAVNFADHFWYRNCMFSNLPNLAALFGYLNAGWTLRVDSVGAYLARVLAQMEASDARTVVPWLAADHGLSTVGVFDDFSSGYLARGRALVPKNATTAPWQIKMDYRQDRKDMARARIDDGILRFTR